ncbi:Protein of unknown function, partial [Gryllus bimaculatus]
IDEAPPFDLSAKDRFSLLPALPDCLRYQYPIPKATGAPTINATCHFDHDVPVDPTLLGAAMLNQVVYSVSVLPVACNYNWIKRQSKHLYQQARLQQLNSNFGNPARKVN